MAYWLQTPICVRRSSCSSLSSLLSLLGLCLLGLATADCEPPPDEAVAEVGVRQQAIVNGSTDDADLTVGLLHSGGSTACTATLIGPRTLLTSGHCVATETAPHSLLTPINYYPDGFSGRRIAAESVAVHPNFAGANKWDLAIVTFSDPIGDNPVHLAGRAPTPGERVNLVGFGKTGETSTDFGTRREASTSIVTVDAQIIRYFGSDNGAGNLCNGDSGGPTFAVRGDTVELVGVHSSKGSGSCGQQGADMRVDPFIGWIVQAAKGDVAAPASWSPSADSAGETGQFSATAEDAAAHATHGCNVSGSEAAPLGGTLLLLLGCVCLARRARRERTN